MEKCEKSIVKLIEKCDNCNLNECINCEISYTEVQEIKKLVNRVKELETRYNNLKSRYNGTKEALRVSEELEKHYSVEASELEQQLFDTISKNKIREEIEKHKKIKELLGIEYKTTKYEDEGKRIRDFYMVVSEDLIVQVLEELLEDK